MQWGALLSIVWPSQIAVLTGESKELWNGVLLALGWAVALVVPPIAGALSDASTNVRGRRWPFLVWGGVLNVGFLLALGAMGKSAGVGWFVVGSLGVQFAGNWWGGPYAGMIPDVVPAERRGLASGYMMAMMAVGWGAGAALAGAFARPGDYGVVYTILAAALAAGLVVTLWRVREPPGATLAHRLDWRAAARGFFPPLRAHADFYWILATRTAVGMGIWGVSTYLLYYLTDVARLPNPERTASLIFLGGAILGVPIGVYAGSLSDRIGRKRLIYVSGGLMAASSTVYVLAGAHPALWVMGVSAALFGVGNSMYSSVDWAFALDALPARETAGKDMGIWHVSMVLPGVVALPVSAIVLSSLKPISLSLAYAAIFALSALWFVIGTVLVRQVKRLR
jgi:MFS family permease